MSRVVDLTGKRFGRYVVIKRDKNKNGHTTWLCRCDCGNEKVVVGQSLKTGATMSCGCLNKEINSERSSAKLVGMRFGRLTVIERVYDHRKKSESAYWLCKCDCGGTVVVNSYRLKTGHTTSCGCYRKETAGKKNTYDQVGREFGKLTVVSRCTDRHEGGYAWWNCICECGGSIEVPTTYLTHGDVSSCGCIRSRGEATIGRILRKYGVEYEKEKKFNDLRDINPLPVDFYIASVNTVVEYHGEQHYRCIDWFGGETQFAQRKTHDKMKEDYCAQNGIKYVAIPYTEKTNEEIEEALFHAGVIPRKGASIYQ